MDPTLILTLVFGAYTKTIDFQSTMFSGMDAEQKKVFTQRYLDEEKGWHDFLMLLQKLVPHLPDPPAALPNA